ncbi:MULTISPECIES: D-alanyl-D-alanine carboxypeptidase DacA [Providencia]|uniref:D-alanyl-D-alanine carboxypeptidase DacA n=1 Tax=Providencia TaxID=586 RepID=UPI000838A7D1|nr:MULTISPECIES: D-alanyl-D-alanine carboxypeptidase DacA [Providencia]MBP6122878.1 D-alanyl-D-alanine carboxypeptidase DacA [Providencia sp.]MDD9341410.1 D-alanyl-D-alanine carboxypeptidase DacA [Providencia heimbachae]NIH23659.1 D-alanyl-D-alanine carboxypeptidase DacA [Providencia heimbachae]
MKNVSPSRFVRQTVLGSALLLLTVSVVNADEAFPNTSIPAVPTIDAEAYILIDYNSGKVLAEKNADQRRDPASLTKMMTSYVIGQAIKSGKIGAEDMVTVSENAWATGNPIFKGSSLMFLKPGDRVSVSQLTRGINLQSGNDACVAMADYIAGDQTNFVQLMNNYVGKLGLQNTHFETVHGLDANGQFSSARDMALIGQALVRDVPEEYAIYKEKEFTFNNIRQTNRNGLLWDKSLAVDGIKTGHTNAAGYNLVASATDNDMRLISVVMGGKSSKGRDAESKKLLTYGFRFYETVKPLQAGVDFATAPVWFGDESEVKLGVTEDLFLTIPRGRLKDLKASYELTTTELEAPLAKGQQVGVISFQLDGKTVEQHPLAVLKDVEEGGFFSRLIDYIKLLFHRWFS